MALTTMCQPHHDNQNVSREFYSAIKDKIKASGHNLSLSLTHTHKNKNHKSKDKGTIWGRVNSRIREGIKREEGM